MVAVEDVVYVVDENLQRLAKGMCTIRRDTARFTAQPLDDLLPEGIEDPEWIPIVGDNGWVLIRLLVIQSALTSACSAPLCSSERQR
ncbi:PIN-like domain-containing protein [Mycobacterium kiyosense]|jgi:hypothetical protein|uniref:VapC45 PIN like domain-containing protein n=1 Tax=Mycobacterium kiyosense TaxID=2871094 RepID=A0AA37PTA6_9MYCO|nr:hypothetical protein SRL2020028_21420 [Mycobacterium kiyosense]GLB99326.1 hypothetical protein SRL2020226_61020 [Mycobacterium kiyosense]